MVCRRKGLQHGKHFGEEVVIAGEEERTVDIVLETIVASTLRGTVLVNGEPIGASLLFLRRPPPTWTDGYLDSPMQLGTPFTKLIRTDAKGRFADTSVIAGTYTVSTMQGEVSADAIMIAAGEEREHVFRIRKVKLHVIVKTANGEPAANRSYSVHSTKGKKRWSLQSQTGATDAKGELTLDPAPAYLFDLVFYESRTPKSPTLRVGPLRAPLDRFEDTIEVTLPASRQKDGKK